MPDKQPHKSDDAQERATRIAEAGAEGLAACPEYSEDNVRAIVLVYSQGRGGIVLHNYREENEGPRAMGDIVQSLEALAQLHGIDLSVFEAPVGGQG